ncbi:secretin and TonB N-terminal domain-containing protein [bacterium]|nr:secretin and TonB N-terminal domain-containing protein [bacterium]
MRPTKLKWKVARAALATSVALGAMGVNMGPSFAQIKDATGASAVTDRTATPERPKLITNPTLLTLNLANADVRALLDMMGKKGGMNLLIDDSVTGMVSLSLKAVPLDEALNLVLKMRGLSARRIGGSLLIASEESFRKKGFSGTQTALLRFDNAKVEDVEKIMKDALSDGAGGGQGGAPGQGMAVNTVNAKIIKDDRTNSLLITAPEDIIDRARALKALLDVPTPQVEIEVKVLELSDSASRKLGFNYGYGGGKFGLGYNNSNPDATAGGPGNQAGNPSTAADGISLTFSALGNMTSNFNVRLDAAISDGQATIMANPKVVAQDNKEANINIVNKYPVLKTLTTTTGTQTDVEFLEVGQKLSLTPRIDPSGFVTMELSPEVSVEGGSALVNGNSVPVVNSRSVKTSMRVRDKESIVIGGLKRTEAVTTVSKVPILGDIPLLGLLFRNNDVRNRQTDIVIIVTPYIQTRISPSTDTVPSNSGGPASGGAAPPSF